MLYEPSKKELKKINNLNKAYDFIKQGMKLLDNNLGYDSNIDLYKWRIKKNLKLLFGRIGKILNKEILDKQFFDIVNPKKKENK